MELIFTLGAIKERRAVMINLNLSMLMLAIAYPAVLVQP